MRAIAVSHPERSRPAGGQRHPSSPPSGSDRGHGGKTTSETERHGPLLRTAAHELGDGRRDPPARRLRGVVDAYVRLSFADLAVPADRLALAEVGLFSSLDR